MTEKRRTPLLLVLGLSALSGALLFLSDYPVHAWPLQLIALCPFLLALERWCRSYRAAALAGLALGLAYTLPLLKVLEFPLLMGLPLGLYLSLLWILIALAGRRVLAWPSPLGPLAVGAVAVIVEWVDFNLVPVWGTAQCFARVWTAAPKAAQIVSLAGVTGLVFVLVAGQALLVRALTTRGQRMRSALILIMLVGLTASWNALSWRAGTRGETGLRVAAIGWTHADLERQGAHGVTAIFEQVYRPLVEEAAVRGASLVVSPEVGFSVTGVQRTELLARLAELAREEEVTLAVGYFDRDRRVNQVVVFDDSGDLRGEYRKTHLIPFIERYQAGRGELLVVDHDGVRLGVMICQDDNFTDLARRYGRAGVQILLVPTNDWRQVKDHHLENSRFRAIENRFVMVRAASNGISAVISARGKLLARRDHFFEGPGLAMAHVRLVGGPTLYSRFGDWLPAVCPALLVLGALLDWRARRRRVSARPATPPVLG